MSELLKEIIKCESCKALGCEGRLNFRLSKPEGSYAELRVAAFLHDGKMDICGDS